MKVIFVVVFFLDIIQRHVAKVIKPVEAWLLSPAPKGDRDMWKTPPYHRTCLSEGVKACKCYPSVEESEADHAQCSLVQPAISRHWGCKYYLKNQIFTLNSLR